MQALRRTHEWGSIRGSLLWLRITVVVAVAAAACTSQPLPGASTNKNIQRSDLSSAADPDSAPDVGIVFVDAQGDLVAVDPVIGSERTLVDCRSECMWPEWSPDGSELAYVTRPGRQSADLWIWDAETGRSESFLQCTSCDLGLYGELEWSPDGSRIAYSHRGHIYVLERSSNPSFYGGLHIAVGSAYEFSWSPDGTRIVFGSSARGPDRIFIANVADPPSGGYIFPRHATKLAVGTDPSWSPDGSRILFLRDGVVFVMNADGSGVTDLLADPAESPYRSARDPVWSPGGSKIAFVHGSDDEYTVAVMNGQGTQLVSILYHLWHCCGDRAGVPTWSPDGSEIAVVVRRFRPHFTEFNGWHLYLLSPTASTASVIQRPPPLGQDATPGRPTWQSGTVASTFGADDIG